MATKNDITGDTLKTKPASDKYRENWDRIFGKKTQEVRGDRNGTKHIQNTTTLR